MKNETDFKDGSSVTFSNPTTAAVFVGVFDYSEGEEKEGFARVRMICTKTATVGDTGINAGDIVYVPINQIIKNSL